VPVIADEYVDREFGTGALKITPAHDLNDYEIGKRHGLESINVMNADATINARGGALFEGMDRFECRKALWKEMDGLGLVIKTEPYVHRVPRSQRGGEIIEPRVSTQWFVRMKTLAEPALEAVRRGDIRFVPDRFEKVYFNWLENIHDWCVSRQLWWGHRVPVWHVVSADDAAAASSSADSIDYPEYFVARNEEEAYAAALAAGLGEGVRLEQDADVLDTWFSSGLWPFATLGWPQKTPELEKFYPNVVLETGYDILFFWVARMIMLGIELAGAPPFSVVYMHGLVRDAKGKKMSKTVGNVIDPLEMIEKYGTDAMRYSLVTGSTPGQDVPLSEEKIESNRNFANKLWNASRYLLGNLNNGQCSEEERAALCTLRASEFGRTKESLASLALPERFIISRLNQLVASVSESLDEYAFGESGRQISEFLWDEYADWYIEISKTRLVNAQDDDAATKERAAAARSTLVFVLDSCLRLLHPFMPFVTEAIWQRMPHDGERELALITAEWPDRDGAVDDAALRAFGRVQALIRAVRNVRAEYQVEPKKRIPAIIVCTAQLEADTLREEDASLELLARLDPAALEIRVVQDSSAGAEEELSSDQYVQLVVADGLQVYLPTTELINVEKETARLNKQLAKMEKDLEGLSKRLNAPGFADKAPPAVVEQTKTQAAELQERIATVQLRLKQLSAMSSSC